MYAKSLCEIVANVLVNSAITGEQRAERHHLRRHPQGKNGFVLAVLGLKVLDEYVLAALLLHSYRAQKPHPLRPRKARHRFGIIRVGKRIVALRVSGCELGSDNNLDSFNGVHHHQAKMSIENIPRPNFIERGAGFEVTEW